ncbi:MAG TPA: AMP-binding protein [Vicinamibacterales bacterium]|nr:AMP-binding protein [Vicinamibacterales bacterium]
MNRETPWLGHYDPGVSATLAPYPERTILDYVSDWASRDPTHPAILFKGSTLTYGELERLSDACAAAFASLGITRGDRIALLLPNCPQFIVAELGAWKIGAVVAPINPLYSEAELEEALRESDATAILVLTRYYERVKHVQPRTSLRHVIATNIKEHFPPLLRLLFTLFREKAGGDRIAPRPGDHDLRSLLTRHDAAPFTRGALSLNDPAILLMSGGTTGTPKAALGAHRVYTYTGIQIRSWNASVLRGPSDVCFVPLPLFHVYANVGLQSLAFVNGSTLALVPNPRDLEDLLATIRRVKPSFFSAVPTLFIALMNHPDVKSRRVDFKSIRVCFSGASALLADTKTRFESLTGGRIVEGYSLTEAMMALCINPVGGTNKTGSVGMPLPDVFIRIYDADEGTRQLGPGEVGEIAISGLQLMDGYWKRPEETALVLRDHADADGTHRWLHTGDLGYVDEDGYVFIVDRKKDMIKTSGYQVWPREVEEVLATHPAVAEVGVAGVSDPVKGEVVHAWIVLRKDHASTEDELRSFCRGQLAPYKVPAHIEFRHELPKTMVGKVLRRALRESATRPR